MGNLGYGFCPTHPGELLKEEIEYCKLSQSYLAKQMGIPYTALNDILNQRRPLTANTSMIPARISKRKRHYYSNRIFSQKYFID